MGHISLETTRSEVALRLKGTGTAKINWNDGTPVKEVKLSMDGDEFKSKPNNNQRTITIDGNNITYLRCTDNLITKLYVSENPALQVLRCRDNKLQTLNINNLTNLKILSCAANKITSLNLLNNKKLEELRCSNNRLKMLNLTNLPNLEICSCHGNDGLELINYSSDSSNPIYTIYTIPEDKEGDVIIDGNDYPKLIELNCLKTKITSLTVRNCSTLNRFICDNNEDLRSIYLESLPELGAVTVCNNQQLIKLQTDAEDCPKLEKLDCSSNGLTNLNLSGFAKLKDLNCRGNEVNNLLLGGCVNLHTLACSGNNISELFIDLNEEGKPNFVNLTTLHCGYNQLSEKTLNNLFEGLPKITANTIAELTIKGNPGAETCDKEIAENKNWKIDPPLRLVRGSHSVIPDIHPVVENVLGKGYDISQGYAQKQMEKGVVLDLNKLNNNGSLSRDQGQKGEAISISSDGRKSYSKNVESQLNIDVSVACFGVSFKSETEQGFSKDETNDETFKYLMKNATHAMESYAITNIIEPDNILGALSNSFLTDLETLTGAQIIRNYGTHVIGGMVLGSTLRYYMKYQKSVSTMSQTKTFSQKFTLGYGPGGSGSAKDEEAKKKNKEAKDKNSSLSNEKKSIGEIIADAIKSGCSLSKIKEAISLLQSVAIQSESQKENNEKANQNKVEQAIKSLGGSSPSFAASASVSFTGSETINMSEELEKMEIKCMLIGGDVTQTMNVMSDPSPENSKDWLTSAIPRDKWAWIDFMPNTIIPIYKFVPQSHGKYEEIKKAWNDYLISQGINFEELKPVDHVITCDFKTRRLPNKTVFSTAGDWEMMGKAGRKPTYTLSFELVNIDGGKAGVDVTLTVMENYGDFTEIEAHELIPLDHNSLGFDKMIIHPSYSKLDTHYEILNEALVTKDSYGWWNATSKAREKKLGFRDDSDNGECSGCLDLSTPLRLQFDGQGKDMGSVGVEGRFKVKVLGFKKKR